MKRSVSGSSVFGCLVAVGILSACSSSSVISPGNLPPFMITVSPPTATLSVGGTVQFVATVTGDSNPGVLRWTSTNSSVATVDSLGNAKAVGPGTAYVAATSGTISGQSEIVVTAPTSAVASRPSS